MNDALSVNEYRYKSMTGDLANMYTSLDHTSIRKAIRWLLYDTNKKGLRDRKMVSIPVNSHDKNITFGRSMDSDNTKITLTYDELVDIVNFDLNNSIFTVGTYTKQQKCGIPMGSPLSPALAVIVCAYYEHRVLSKIEKHSWDNKVYGTRYMDDVFCVATHDGTPTSIHRANIILKWFEVGYHKNMTLECEDTTKSFKFLSSSMTAFDNSPITYEYYNKNIESILCKGSQKFLTFQHYGSLAPVAQKRSVVVSSLHRLCMNSNSKSDCTKAKNELFIELRFLKYPYSILRDAEKRVMIHERYTALPEVPMIHVPLLPNTTETPEVPDNIVPTPPVNMGDDLYELEKSASRSYLMLANFGTYGNST